MDKVRNFIQPIKKKWVYHFIVSPRTSIIDKPEWYLNQTLKWTHEHIDKVETNVKLDSTDTKDHNVGQLFILCMVELAMMRLKKDMDKISSELEGNNHNKAVMIHTYNEVMCFVKVIHKLLGDSYFALEDDHDLLSVFCHQNIFEKIIDVEWECAEKNLREITGATSRWELVLDGEFVDPHQIPKCVDRFLLLIISLKERVDHFLQPDCQFMLIELQLSLFDKFLTFLKGSIGDSSSLLSGMLMLNYESSANQTKVSRCLNGVRFLRRMLKEKHFIPSALVYSLDSRLLERLSRLARDYEAFQRKLEQISNCS